MPDNLDRRLLKARLDELQLLYVNEFYDTRKLVMCLANILTTIGSLHLRIGIEDTDKLVEYLEYANLFTEGSADHITIKGQATKILEQIEGTVQWTSAQDTIERADEQKSLDLEQKKTLEAKKKFERQKNNTIKMLNLMQISQNIVDEALDRIQINDFRQITNIEILKNFLLEVLRIRESKFPKSSHMFYMHGMDNLNKLDEFGKRVKYSRDNLGHNRISHGVFYDDLFIADAIIASLEEIIAGLEKLQVSSSMDRESLAQTFVTSVSNEPVGVSFDVDTVINKVISGENIVIEDGKPVYKVLIILDYFQNRLGITTVYPAS